MRTRHADTILNKNTVKQKFILSFLHSAISHGMPMGKPLQFTFTMAMAFLVRLREFEIRD